MYTIQPEAIWNHLLHELFSWETALYALGTVVFFGIVVLVLNFLDSTRGGNQ